MGTISNDAMLLILFVFRAIEMGVQKRCGSTVY